jgi:hypothetical protein
MDNDCPKELKWLDSLERLGWTLWGFGDMLSPIAVAALHQSAFRVTVVMVSGVDDVAAYSAIVPKAEKPFQVQRGQWYARGPLSVMERFIDTHGKIPVGPAVVAAAKPIPDVCRPPRIEPWVFDRMPGSIPEPDDTPS